MKYNLVINQKAILENNLKIDSVDAMILDIIRDMASYEKVEKKYIGNTVFFWVNHLNLALENPILGIKTSDGIYRRMVKMSEIGLILIHPENKKSRKSFYAISDLFNTIFIRCLTSDEKPNKKNNIGFKTDVTSDEKPKDYNINDYSISKVSKDTLLLFDSIDSNNTDITNITINNKESEKNFSEKNEFEERQKKCRKDMIHFFCKEYWPTYKFFAGRDGKAINEIIEQSKKHLDYHGADSSPESIFEFFKVVVHNLPDFFKYKNLSQINSSYSGILKQIQDGRNKNYRETELERNQRRTEEILAKLREQRS